MSGYSQSLAIPSKQLRFRGLVILQICSVYVLAHTALGRIYGMMFWNMGSEVPINVGQIACRGCAEFIPNPIRMQVSHPE
jgi:hypothetical protein